MRFGTVAFLSVVALGAGALLPSVATASRDGTDAACHRSVYVLLDALTDVDGQLEIGLNFREYRALLRKANVAHARIPAGRLRGVCLDAGVRLERALNFYTRALKSWSTCIDKLDCEGAVGENFRQRMWRNASANVQLALNQLG